MSDRRPHVAMLVVPNPYSKTGANMIILAWRRWRSKYVVLQCFCKRKRKDGTCQTLDALIPHLVHPERTRFSHEEHLA